jgi:hypothetical protein
MEMEQLRTKSATYYSHHFRQDSHVMLYVANKQRGYMPSFEHWSICSSEYPMLTFVWYFQNKAVLVLRWYLDEKSLARSPNANEKHFVNTEINTRS